VVAIAALRAQATDGTANADGLRAYLGVVPAEIVKGHPSKHPEAVMHGGAPEGAHEYHIVVAIFDTATGDRISNATVTAKVSGLGLLSS
jgi:hypothetical protein